MLRRVRLRQAAGDGRGREHEERRAEVGDVGAVAAAPEAALHTGAAGSVGEIPAVEVEREEAVELLEQQVAPHRRLEGAQRPAVVAAVGQQVLHRQRRVRLQQ